MSTLPLERSPLVSVSLPLAIDADPRLLDQCLQSVRSQSYSNIELLIFLTEGSNADLSSILLEHSGVIVQEGIATKSAARNILAVAASGKYMMYLDVDLQLSGDLVAICVKKCIEGGFEAITASVHELPTENPISKLRSFERMLLETDLQASVPILLDLEAFREVGGFDERLNILDDWSLTLKFRERGFRIGAANAVLWVRESSNIRELFRRKLVRGRAFPALKRAYPDASFTRFGGRFIGTYLQNWRLLLKSPLLTVGLVILKSIEMLGLYLGIISAPALSPISDGTSPYFREETAKSYERIRLGTNFQRYKHHCELTALRSLIESSAGQLLEVGC